MGWGVGRAMTTTANEERMFRMRQGDGRLGPRLKQRRDNEGKEVQWLRGLRGQREGNQHIAGHAGEGERHTVARDGGRKLQIRRTYLGDERAPLVGRETQRTRRSGIA